MIDEIEILRQLDDRNLHGRVTTELEVLQDQHHMRTSFGRREVFLMDKFSRKAIKIVTDGSFSFDAVVSKLNDLGFYLDRPIDREEREQFFYYPRNCSGVVPTGTGDVFDSGNSVFPAEMFGGEK